MELRIIQARGSPIKMINPQPNIGIIGLGEVFLEYAYPALSNLERQGVISIQKVADIKDISGTVANLKGRHLKYPKERNSIDDVIGRLDHTKNPKNPIAHYQTTGDNFAPATAADFFQDLDIVYIATPNNVRVELIRQAAEYEKAIIIEKPAAHTTRTLNEIIDILNRHDARAICAEHYAYKDPSLEFFRTFEEQTKNFGKITFIEGALYEDDFLDAERYEWLLDPSISGGGIWLDTGVHMMHLLYATGAEVEDVVSASSFSYKFPTGNPKNKIIRSETAADVLVSLNSNTGRVDRNALAHLKVAKCMPYSSKYFKVLFEKGAVFLDFMNSTISYSDLTGQTPKLTAMPVQKTNPYENMVRMFVDRIGNGGSDLPTRMEKAIESTGAIFRVYKSMKEGDSRMFY